MAEMPHKLSTSRWTRGGPPGAVMALVLGIATLLALAPDAPAQRTKAGGAPPVKDDLRALIAGAQSWGYQLQNVEAKALDATTYDVLVVDAGSGDGKWGLSRDDIRRLKSKPDGSRRIVLAYINIGEAEDYRYYWQKAWDKTPPAWMGAENCRWRGDHRVRHWAPEWQRLIFGSPTSYLARLVDAGYDGAWLDRVDIFYYWRGERWQAADDMVRFVTALSAWAKARREGFLIVPQNGEELLSDRRYRAAIDAQGKEDMLLGDRGNDVRNTEARIGRAKRNMAPLLAEGRPVLAVEYARRKDLLPAIEAELRALGLRPYFGPRSLAYLGFDGTTHKEDGDTEPTAADAGDESCE